MTLQQFRIGRGVRPALERYDRSHDGKTWIVTADKTRERYIGYATDEQCARAGAALQIEDGYDEVFLWPPSDGGRYFRYYRDENGQVVSRG